MGLDFLLGKAADFLFQDTGDVRRGRFLCGTWQTCVFHDWAVFPDELARLEKTALGGGQGGLELRL